MANPKKRQLAFYAEPDVDAFLEQVTSAKKTETINLAIRDLMEKRGFVAVTAPAIIAQIEELLQKLKALNEPERCTYCHSVGGHTVNCFVPMNDRLTSMRDKPLTAFMREDVQSENLKQLNEAFDIGPGKGKKCEYCGIRGGHTDGCVELQRLI
ncbi:MAG TPA: hypothetical protein V6C76_11560 [Drouetiella sp.]